MRYYYTYRIEHTSGKYYVGRHTTNKINDGYKGSGKWVKSIHDKDSLTKTILEYFNNEDSLLIAEQLLIDDNIDNPLCMNFNNKNVGFASGNLNPAHLKHIKEAKSERFKQNNPSKIQSVRDKKSALMKGRTSPSKGFVRSPEIRKKLSDARIGLKISNEGRKKLSESRKKQIATGERIIPTFKGLTHNNETRNKMSVSALNRKKEQCSKCRKIVPINMLNRWHNDNCKTLTV